MLLQIYRVQRWTTNKHTQNRGKELRSTQPKTSPKNSATKSFCEYLLTVTVVFFILAKAIFGKSEKRLKANMRYVTCGSFCCRDEEQYLKSYKNANEILFDNGGQSQCLMVQSNAEPGCSTSEWNSSWTAAFTKGRSWKLRRERCQISTTHKVPQPTLHYCYRRLLNPNNP